GSEDLAGKTVVSMEMVGKDRNYRNYAVFNSHIDLFECIKARAHEYRRLHEIVMGGRCQKPRFDIDIEREDLPEGVDDILEFGDVIKDRLIAAIIDVLAQSGIKINLTKNVVVCSSHSHDKCSYHVIIDGYIHGSSEEAQAFFEEIAKVIEEPSITLKYIDDKIYSDNHGFRLLWCHKIKSPRIKIFNTSFTYNGDEYTHQFRSKVRDENHLALMMLEASMVTFISGCDILPIYELASKK